MRRSHHWQQWGSSPLGTPGGPKARWGTALGPHCQDGERTIVKDRKLWVPLLNGFIDKIQHEGEQSKHKQGKNPAHTQTAKDGRWLDRTHPEYFGAHSVGNKKISYRDGQGAGGRGGVLTQKDTDGVGSADLSCNRLCAQRSYFHECDMGTYMSPGRAESGSQTDLQIPKEADGVTGLGKRCPSRRPRYTTTPPLPPSGGITLDVSLGYRGRRWRW